jgi:hypothetical protein
MRLRRIDAETMEISDLDLLGCELLQQIVVSAQVDDHPVAQERLYSSPTEAHDPAFEEDWKNYVQPDLRELFRSAQEVVTKDLKNFPAEDSGDDHILLLPVEHLEDWIHCLNQARLALSARFEFTEHDLEEPLPFHGDQRALALFQVHFYGFLQECFLRQLD